MDAIICLYQALVLSGVIQYLQAIRPIANNQPTE